MTTPPIVDRGPWKPPAAVLPPPTLKKDWMDKSLEIGGVAVGMIRAAYTGAALIEILFFLFRVLGSGLYLLAKVIFHLLK